MSCWTRKTQCVHFRGSASSVHDDPDTSSQGFSIKRLHNVTGIFFNESNYERSPNSLRERHDELTAFRLQMGALKQPEPHSAGVCVHNEPLPADFLRYPA